MQLEQRIDAREMSRSWDRAWRACVGRIGEFWAVRAYDMVSCIIRVICSAISGMGWIPNAKPIEASHGNVSQHPPVHTAQFVHGSSTPTTYAPGSMASAPSGNASLVIDSGVVKGRMQSGSIDGSSGALGITRLGT
ncbi:hypothetical protein JB92DRAFT_2836593 [Gautieria morchelliformis]|nr:hypothetical protein JB92DRAFT_2836593 [Gautieria morchelliformis]